MAVPPRAAFPDLAVMEGLLAGTGRHAVPLILAVPRIREMTAPDEHDVAGAEGQAALLCGLFAPIGLAIMP